MSSSGRRRRFWAGDLRRPHTPTSMRRAEIRARIHSSGWRNLSRPDEIMSSVAKLPLCDTKSNSNICNLPSQITSLPCPQNQIHCQPYSTIITIMPGNTIPVKPTENPKCKLWEDTSGRKKCGNSLSFPEKHKEIEKCNDESQKGVIRSIDIQPKAISLYLIQPLDRLAPAHSSQFSPSR